MAKVKLINLTLREFFCLEDTSEYLFAFEHSPDFKKAVDHLSIGNVRQKPFGMVKDIQELYSGNVSTLQLIEQLILFSEKTEDELLNLGILEFIQSRNYLEQAIESISEIESLKFGREATDEEKRAGIDRMGLYGVEIQIERLCKGEIWNRDIIRALPYNRCFNWLAMWNDRAEFDEELQRIRSQKKPS